MTQNPHRPEATAHSLVVDGLRKTLGGKVVLNGVSFVAEPGRVIGLLGPNGAGKTTTLKALSGLTVLDAGSVRYGNMSWENLPPTIGGLCAVFEQSGVSNLAKAGSHLTALARYYGKSTADVASVAEQVGLSAALRKRVATYSLGMRRRLGLAEVLLAEPRWVLLDEPMNGLDPEGMMWLRGTIDTLRRSGCVVVISSHLLNEISSLIDDVVVMRAGKVLFSGTQHQMLTSVGDWVTPREIRDPRLEEVCREMGVVIVSSDAGTPIIAREDLERMRTAVGSHQDLPATDQIQMSLQQAYFLMLQREEARQ